MLSASPADGTLVDIHTFQVVRQSSGKDDYYRVESGPDGPYLAARYRPPFDTMVRGIDTPQHFRRTLTGVRWRWRVHAFPKGGDDCNPDVGDAAAGVFATFKAGLKVMVIKYVWNSVGPVNRSCQLANNLFFAKHEVVLRSGGEVDTWQTETVDPRRDFARYYGGKLEDVPDFVALGVLTDGDATNSRSEADYADFILFDRRPEPVQAQAGAVAQRPDAGIAEPDAAPPAVREAEAQPGH
ncbi:MAG TPA: DUF3047 domain-containing protein [Kineosporiaceae bacterium]|nr:DUF3047 domain-containing protein [Kineosporiaceae bacterium]